MNKEIFVKNKYYFNVILTILNTAIIVFIFSRSLTPDYISAEESGNVTGFLNYLFPFQLSDHIVRKLAHFVEFAGLGFFTGLNVFSYYRKPLGGTIVKLFICLGTAVLDEAIQLNVQGRSGQITDVLLDFSGSVCGIVIITVALLLILYMKKRKKGR